MSKDQERTDRAMLVVTTSALGRAVTSSWGLLPGVPPDAEKINFIAVELIAELKDLFTRSRNVLGADEIRRLNRIIDALVTANAELKREIEQIEREHYDKTRDVLTTGS